MMKKRTFLLVFCALLVLSSAAMGTIAYMTDWAAAINTFSVGDMAIRVDESAVNPDGTLIEGADRVTGNDYHLLPGATYVKDPKVTMTKGSDSAYVRMLVTINRIKELNAIFPEGFLPEAHVSGWDATLWPCVGVTDNGDNTATYEFRYHTAVAAPMDADLSLEPLFTAITVPGSLTREQMSTIADLQITVVGEAVQSSNFPGETEAWAAFDAQEAN